MWEWLATFFDPTVNANLYDQNALAAAIEKTVEGTDPRLRLVHNYKKKLANSVQSALQYTDILVTRSTQPIPTNRQAYSLDPRVHAFFTSADEMQRIFSLDKGMRTFFGRPENQELQEGCALLAMKKQEKKIFGYEMEAGIIKRDVPQTAVTFSDHRLLAPARNANMIKEKLRKLAFNTLVECALANILDIRVHQHELEEQRRLLQEKLSTQKRNRYGLESVLEANDDYDHDDEVSEETLLQLRKIEHQLHKAKVDLRTLDDYLAQVNGVLSQPEKYLRLETVSVMLNRLGIQVNASGNGDEITFHEVQMRESRRFALALVVYPRHEMMPPKRYLEMLLV
jgi:hypothetical protein